MKIQIVTQTTSTAACNNGVFFKSNVISEWYIGSYCVARNNDFPWREHSNKG